MKLFLDVIVFCIMLGLVETFVKPIVISVTRRKTLKYAPVALRFIDEKFALGLEGMTPKDLERYLKDKLEVATGESWDVNELEDYFKVFDLRKSLLYAQTKTSEQEQEQEHS